MAVSFPTGVQEEAGDLWSIPTLSRGEPGHVRVADDSAGRAEIVDAGRAKGGAGRFTLRTTADVSSGTAIRIALTGQVPKVVPHRPFRVVEMDAETGALAAIPPERVAIPPISAGAAVAVVATIPSDIMIGESARVHLSALDAFGNVDRRFRGLVRLDGDHPGLPDSFAFEGTEPGIRSVEGLRPATAGILRISGQVQSPEGPVRFLSNPARIWTFDPLVRRYWGDAHFHSGSDVATVATDGGDHRGQFVSSDDAMTYLRDVSACDWGISAEHDTGLSAETWLANQARVESGNAPGRFVTLLGYEWTPPRRLGHHVVVFEGAPGPGNVLVGASSGRRGGEGAASVAELAASVRSRVMPASRILLIPHIMQPYPNDDAERDDNALRHETWDGPPGAAPGAYVFNDVRRVGEIYSHHNDDFAPETYAQTREGRGDAVNQPQLFELGVSNPWSYQHAWSTGHRIGVIGGSDNHLGTPGLNDYATTVPHHAGLAVVFAPKLARADVFEALYARRCYATTGARILLEFDVDGLPMGSEARRRTGSRLPIRVSVSGTAPLEAVEVLKLVDGTFVTLGSPGTVTSGLDASIALEDTFTAATVYYVRVRQADGEWAWSSPVWVDPETSAR